MKKTPGPMPTLIGHRGLPINAPENTAASLRCAAAEGIDWVEIDVTMAGDGSLVIMHDSTLALFGQPNKRLVDLNKTELNQVDAGQWFGAKFKGEPLLYLDSLLALIIELKLNLNLEIKINPDIDTAPQVDAVYSVLRQTQLNNNQLIISSFHHQALAMLRQHSAALNIAVLFEKIPAQLLSDVIHLHPISIHCAQGFLTEDQARHICAHYPLYCYTVNDTVTLKKLLSWGVTGVFSDRAHAEELRALC